MPTVAVPVATRAPGITVARRPRSDMGYIRLGQLPRAHSVIDQELMDAAIAGNVDEVGRILREGGKGINMDFSDVRGNTILHWTAARGYAKRHRARAISIGWNEATCFALRAHINLLFIYLSIYLVFSYD